MAVSMVIDAGHGGYDNGATYNDRREKDDVLRLSMAVGQILKENGYHITYTRTEDEYASPFEKAQIANNAGGDYFISIHRNSSPRSNMYSGVQTLLYSLEEEQAVKMGNDINESLEKIGFKNLGLVARPGLVVLRRTKMPAILVEAGFINTDADNLLFDTKFNEMAQAIADGIMEAAPIDVTQESQIPQGDTPGSRETVGGAKQDEKEYAVQIGLFRYESNAIYQKEILEEAGFPSVIAYEEPYYSVKIDTGKNLEEAISLQAKLRRMGYDTIVVTK
ncbi:MAG: N-acetylmuramoyl-L-alanine amidase [Lachnospiraceae bacterium]